MNSFRRAFRFISNSNNGNGNNSDTPRSLTETLLPQLSKPSVCLISGLLLVLAHGIKFLEKFFSIASTSSSVGQHNDNEQCYNENPESYWTYSTSLLSNLLLSINPQLLYLILCLSFALALLRLQYHRMCGIIHKTSPIPGITPVPNAHPYMGHFTAMLNISQHQFLFRDHATPSGISAFWGPGLKRCASVLLASHARVILRQNSDRDFSEWLIRHGKKTLGDDSLILISGGNKWKSVRSVTARAFTHKLVRDGRKVVREKARECVDWLHGACENTRRHSTHPDQECLGHGINEHGQGTVCVQAEDFFKLFALNVFGKVAMGYDFRCFPTSSACGPSSAPVHEKTESCEDHQRTRSSRSSSSCDSCCTCLKAPPVARALQYLETDMGIRANPKAMLNPAMQIYSIPTKYNQEYHKNKELVNGLMGRVIEQELDSRLRVLEAEEERERTRTGFRMRRRRTDETSVSSSSTLEDDDREMMDETDSADDSKSSAPVTMVAYLVQSSMEQHFSQQELGAGRSSKCPFAPSSQNDTKSPSCINTENHIPPASQITAADKATITKKVIQLLHTNLVAGYETTALSLSYTMYTLSKNPRCQERCSEEARRVMHTLDDKEADVDDDDLPYCRAVFQESIRLHLPILFTTRVLSKDLTLNTGYDDEDSSQATLLKGTRLHINPTLIHLDERNFERASEFIPERWVRWDDKSGRWVDRNYEAERMASSSSNSQADKSTPPIQSYTAQNEAVDSISAANPANFFSFSDGARNCVGRRLAVMESTLLVASLMKDLYVGLGVKDGENFELVRERRFVTVKPSTLPIRFWKRP